MIVGRYAQLLNMTEEQLDKLLAKIPVDKVYSDLLQPGLQTVGHLLSDVFDVGNLALLPFKLLNERSKIYLRHNLQLFETKLKSIEDQNKCKVSPQVGLPILDKLLLVNQKELSEMFVNLLTKASDLSTQDLVHPAFINILNNMSQDEAIILFALRNEPRFPSIDIVVKKTTIPYFQPEHFNRKGAKTRAEVNEKIEFETKTQVVEIDAAYNLTSIEKNIKLYFPSKIDLYLENLAQFGIIRFVRTKYYSTFNEQYSKMIDSDYAETYAKIKSDCSLANKQELINHNPVIKKGYVEFTEFGKTFLEAVATNIEDLKRA